MPICSGCSKPLPSGARFCPECGASAAAGSGSTPKGRSSPRDVFIIAGVLTLASILFFAFRPSDPRQPTVPTPVEGHEEMGGMGDMGAVLADLPADYESLVHVGNSFMDNGNYPMAAESYKRALAIDGSSADVRVDYGACLHGMGLSERAIEEFLAVVQDHPDHTIVYFNLGIVYYSLNQPDSARLFWNKYLERDPNGQVAEAVREYLKKIGS
ncbi:MAG: tetratricopeptide repeat protein [Candidatus Zixiibacteriota bacterium]